MSKIYLAIPYTGIEEQSFKLVNEVAADLMNDGEIVFSPISQNHPIAVQCNLPQTWDFWQAFDESFINWCDKLLVVKLNGWETSVGVTTEIGIATRLGKVIEYLSI